ncbi:MAG: hypothetical protein CL946_13590 [Ectothiorhodospiraceae bacterium]|nr:hypothetical protein [Ectothiorhodospiraceae bacterium]
MEIESHICKLGCYAPMQALQLNYPAGFAVARIRDILKDMLSYRCDGKDKRETHSVRTTGLTERT